MRPCSILAIDPGKHGGLFELRIGPVAPQGYILAGGTGVWIKGQRTPLLQAARAATAAKIISDAYGDVTGFTKAQKSQRAEVDEKALVGLIQKFAHAPSPYRLMVIEKVGGLPRQSAAGGFVFGRLVGLCIGAAHACGLPVIEVRPQDWKAPYGLGSDKAAALAAATRIYGTNKLWPLKGDDGVAEAAIMAHYAATVLLKG